jgi:uncharacterized Ntn-hydrolase superfamily protein
MEGAVSTTATTQTLQDTIGRLEEALLTPSIAGELTGWIRSAEQAAATLAVDWTRHLHSVQHPQYRETARSDAEQLPHVEKLIAAEESLLQELAHFHEELRALAQQASQAGWDEGKLAARRQQVEEAGLQLLLRIKKQKLAGESCLAESLFRDRGTKD